MTDFTTVFEKIAMQKRINDLTAALKYMINKYGNNNRIDIKEDELEKFNCEEGGIHHNNMEKEGFSTFVYYPDDESLENHSEKMREKHMDECNHNPKNKMEENIKDIDKLSSLLSQLKNLAEKNK